MRVKPGYFYIKFHDETTEQAIESHSVGFASVAEAMEEADFIERPGHAYVVLNDKLEIVAGATTK